MASKPKILLVNPPIYDFAAYDFWQKPYGMLSVAGFLRGNADFVFFDYLDREHPFSTERENLRSDRWGRGRFYSKRIKTPEVLESIPRRYQRFGLPRKFFLDFLIQNEPFDFALVQTTMTYWYPAIEEVISDIRANNPKTKIVLGGVYTSLCPGHAKSLGAELVIEDGKLETLWDQLGIEPDLSQPPLWESYDKLNTGVMKLTDGCPFNCTYCAANKLYPKFAARDLKRCLAEFDLLIKQGAKNISFYDDAILHNTENILVPFLEEVLRRDKKINFHTPNGLNARFMTKELTELMVRAGFKTFFLGFESSSVEWQHNTGSKVYSAELDQAVSYLLKAGVNRQDITAYLVLGHPKTKIDELEASMHFVNSLGIRVMLADFSPLPGTPDGELCRKWVDLDEPLMHNKTAFPVILWGFDEGNRLKNLCRKLNRSLPNRA